VGNAPQQRLGRIRFSELFGDSDGKSFPGIETRTNVAFHEDVGATLASAGKQICNHLALVRCEWGRIDEQPHRDLWISIRFGRGFVLNCDDAGIAKACEKVGETRPHWPVADPGENLRRLARDVFREPQVIDARCGQTAFANFTNEIDERQHERRECHEDDRANAHGGLPPIDRRGPSGLEKLHEL
jgi:hypothetical protein